MDNDPSTQGWTVLTGSPFMDLVGPLWVRGTGDQRRFAFRAEARHANRHHSVHGGMLSAFLDTCMGYALPADAGPMKGTIALDIQFLDPALEGDWVEGSARIRRMGRSLIFLDGELRVGDRVIAVGQSIVKTAHRTQGR